MTAAGPYPTFDAFYRAQHDRLFHFFRRKVGREEAPDLVAPAWLDAAISDRAIVHDKRRKAAATVLGYNAVECPQTCERLLRLGVSGIEPGSIHHGAIAEKVEPTGKRNDRARFSGTVPGSAVHSSSP